MNDSRKTVGKKSDATKTKDEKILSRNEQKEKKSGDITSYIKTQILPYDALTGPSNGAGPTAWGSVLSRFSRRLANPGNQASPTGLGHVEQVLTSAIIPKAVYCRALLREYTPNRRIEMVRKSA